MTTQLKNEYIAMYYQKYNILPTKKQLARFILFNK